MTEIKDQDDAISEVSSVYDISHPREMEWRLKIFLEFLEVYLIRLALETSRTRIPSSTGISTEESCQHMSRSTGKQYHSIAEKILIKLFAPYAAAATESDPANIEKVIRSILLPGCPPLKAEVMLHLFDLCSNRNTRQIEIKTVPAVNVIPASAKLIVSPEGVSLASPNILLQLMFGESEPEAVRRPASAPAPSSSGLPRTSHKKDKTCNTNNDNNNIDTKPLRKKKKSKQSTAKGAETAAGGSSPVLKRCNAKRDQIGHGPIRMNGISRPNVLSVQSINYNSAALDTPTCPTTAEIAANKIMLPSKLTTSRSKTALNMPTRFDPLASIQRSNTIPKHELKRKHVFGMSSSLYSGSAVSMLPTESSVSAAPDQADQVIDRAVIAYPSAGLGVIHDLTGNKQTHYNGHTEDVTCMAISFDGSLAATGCNGKAPCVHIWDTNITDPTKSLLVLGLGFFYRGVCAVEFSYDSQYLVGVSCDDYHMVGIFNLLNGDRVCEAHGQKGLPPLIKWIRFCPEVQNTSHISREHSGLCDVFASAGEAGHIMLWSFRREQQVRTMKIYASLRSKALRMTNCAPKSYLCCGFIPCEENDTGGPNNFDMIAGGSNGKLFLFEKNLCALSKQILNGKISCLDILVDKKAADCKVVIGGSEGSIKVLLARSFVELHSFRGDDLITPISTAKITAVPLPSQSSPALSASLSIPLQLGTTSKEGHPSTTTTTTTSTTITPLRRNSMAERLRRSLSLQRGKLLPKGAETTTSVDKDDPASEENRRKVTGLAAVTLNNSHIYIVATLGCGQAVRLDISPAQIQNSSLSSNTMDAHWSGSSAIRRKVLFHYHMGALHGLAVTGRRYCATVGDDRQLILWDLSDCIVVAKTTLKNVSRACHIDRRKTFIAVGCADGSLTLYHVTARPTISTTEAANIKDDSIETKLLTEVAYRKDTNGECTEVKFSPSNDMIAVGTRDDVIYLYTWSSTFSTARSHSSLSGQDTASATSTSSLSSAPPPPSYSLKLLHKLQGHSSTISCIDWSSDSLLIQSVCNAYELICWDVPTGKVNSTVNSADVRWRTRHCKLGFNVMGIWPPYSNGTEVNSVDVCVEKGLVVTANNRSGLSQLFNYPCVVKSAPCKSYSGHSSHVMKIRFLVGGDVVATVGGRDASLQVWDCIL